MKKNNSKRTAWLLCYDIADERRLNSVHRIVSRQAIMLQYSVYWLDANETELSALGARLAAVINHKKDDIRIYPVPEHPRADLIGDHGIARTMLQNQPGASLLHGEHNHTTARRARQSARPTGNPLTVKYNYREAVKTETRKKGD